MENLSVEITTKPQSPLYKAMHKMLMLEKPEENLKPTICILSLMKRNFSVMRSVQMLCGLGYIGCLLKLRSIHEKYKKNVMTLMFEDFDSEVYDNALGSLFIGNIPVINIAKCNRIPLSAKPNPYASLCYDDHFVKLLTSGPSRSSTPESEYADAVEIPREVPNVSEAVDCLQVFPLKRDGEEEEEEEEFRSKMTSANQSDSQSHVYEKCIEAVENRRASFAVECQEIVEEMQGENLLVIGD